MTFWLLSYMKFVFVALALVQLVGVVQGQEPQEETDKIESAIDQPTAAAVAATAAPALDSNAMDIEKDGIHSLVTHSLHEPKSLISRHGLRLSNTLLVYIMFWSRVQKIQT